MNTASSLAGLSLALLALFGNIYEGSASPIPHSMDEAEAGFDPLSTNNNTDEVKRRSSASTYWFDGTHPNGDPAERYYAKAEANGFKTGELANAGVEVGLIRTDKDKAWAVGAEAGFGLMGRVVAYDGKLAREGFGSHVRVGAGLDTGLIFKDGIEAKLFGIGGYVGRKGVQLCIVVCFSIG